MDYGGQTEGFEVSAVLEEHDDPTVRWRALPDWTTRRDIRSRIFVFTSMSDALSISANVSLFGRWRRTGSGATEQPSGKIVHGGSRRGDLSGARRRITATLPSPSLLSPKVGLGKRIDCRPGNPEPSIATSERSRCQDSLLWVDSAPHGSAGKMEPCGDELCMGDFNVYVCFPLKTRGFHLRPVATMFASRVR